MELRIYLFRKVSDNLLIDRLYSVPTSVVVLVHILIYRVQQSRGLAAPSVVPLSF